MWITGFTDAEGSFIVSITKNNERIIGWKVQVIFGIYLHGRDIQILNQIQSYFGVGKIYTDNKRGTVNYLVRSPKDLNSTIIPQFNKYKLLTQKKADFELFSTIVNLIIQNQHKTEQGFKKIVELRASLNNGLTGELLKVFSKENFLIKRPEVELAKDIDLTWIVGFIDGEGCFTIGITPSKNKTGFGVQLNFNITQHIRDKALFWTIKKKLGCGNVNEIPAKYRVNFVVTKLSDIINIIIPLLVNIH
uniref:Homing endonuclease LAGLIDADG domain-containing protein n=1 Tax=Orbilia brochopaga TaxID=3140254 RepID=A0A4Y5MV55_9PEZI|nr:hypothetical protein [Drechslerella brochopaga]